MNPRIKLTVTSAPPNRGGVPQPAETFYCQSATLTKSWGSAPGTAELVYVGTTVPNGSSVQIEVAGHIFYGTCTAITPLTSTGGNEIKMSFVDLRDYLNWDVAYCAFNKPEHRLINNYYVRRYWHILPQDFNTLTKTYTDTPYTAAQIINFLLLAPTTEDPWTFYTHPDQNYPVYELDFLQGTKLQAALQEVCDKQGLVFTLAGYYVLLAARKGEGAAFTIPSDTDNREDGLAISGHPTRIRVLGDRNRYQVHDIPLRPGWNTAWQQFYDALLFMDDIYQRGTLTADATIGGTTYAAGTLFTAVSDGDDPERIVTRQLANGRAHEITVWEYAELRGDHPTWDDHRGHRGTSRLDMPAILYIQNILFRAFDLPVDFSVRNADNYYVPMRSLSMEQTMIAAVVHDSTTGAMSWYDNEPPVGNGYAIVQGYQVGKDLFRTLKPDRFDLNIFRNTQDVWEHIEFEIDDGGENDMGYVLFSEPVIRSEDLVDMVDDLAVFRARPVFNIPNVRAAIIFQAEVFSYILGNGTRDDVAPVSGLHSEFTSTWGGAPQEVPYADGDYATDKADTIAASILNNQYVYRMGKCTRYPMPNGSGNYTSPMLLSPQVDRIVIRVSPDGIEEQAELTNERPRTTYVPERELERTARMRNVLPGQETLRATANIHKLTAAALQKDSGARRVLIDAFRGQVGKQERPTLTTVTGGSAGKYLPAGTVLRREVGKTKPVLPEDVDDTHKVFVGVTTRQNEPTGGHVPINDSGLVLALVTGPAEANDSVGLEGFTTVGALEKGGTPSVGVVLQDVAEGETRLCQVRIGSSSVTMFEVSYCRNGETITLKGAFDRDPATAGVGA